MTVAVSHRDSSPRGFFFNRNLLNLHPRAAVANPDYTELWLSQGGRGRLST